MECLGSVTAGNILYNKQCNDSMSNRLWQQRLDVALQRLICICGFLKLNEYDDLEKKQDLFKAVLDLIKHVKSRLIKHTKLMVSLCK